MAKPPLPPAEDAANSKRLESSPEIRPKTGIRPQIRSVRAVVNPLSGSVEAGAADALRALLADRDLAGEVVEVEPGGVEAALKAAVAAKPDVLILLAGDGTARLAAELCGPDGPLLAALPGGTMNMLPHALYGPVPWREALSKALDSGVERRVSGGEADGRRFFVAAILGSPALWAPAREAIREGKLKLAVLRARRALKRAFSGHLRFSLDGGERCKTEALILMCPLVSRALERTDALEALAVNPKGAGAVVRLGAHALLSDLIGDWREDPSVTAQACQAGRMWARAHIPAVLDGEPHRLHPDTRVRFIPDAFRALSTLPPPEPAPAAAKTDPTRAEAATAVADARRWGSRMRRLLQLSDVHFGGEHKAASEAAIAFATDYAPLAVVMTGDLTLNGLPDEFRTGAAWYARLPQPRVITPGNHDTPYWNIPARAFFPFNRYRRWVGDPDGGAFDSPSLGVRMINTARGAQPRPDWSKGAIKLDLCSAVAADLDRSDPAALRVVGVHHPLVEAEGIPVTGGVYRGAQAATLLAEGGVDLILSGHVHNPFAVALPAAGDGLTYAVGAGTLSERLRGTPPSFNTIEWDDAHVTVTAQGWTGDAFEPFRTWDLPRRPRRSSPLPLAGQEEARVA